MDATPRTALVDESFRRGHDGRGYALLAAVIVPATSAAYHALDVTALIYCQETASRKKVEQARVRSIWAMLTELNDRRVRTLVFESRQERNDRKDRREVLGAQKAGVADPALVYRHGRPKEEPLLWLPDAIAGTVGEQAADGNSEFLNLLPPAMCRIRWLHRP